jgi:predicted amidohydrolase
MPGRESERDENSLVGRFSRLADELNIYLVINLITKGPEGKERNSVLAFDREGRVVGRHHKFELYGSEREELTPGNAVAVFETPFGRVGLLVCADIYGQPALHRELMHDLDARIIAWSAAWTVEGATRWQSTFARDWNVYFVAANGAKGLGGGGGVFDPDGESIGTMELDASIVYAEIPR